jgi:hypothetical protein
MPVPIRSIPDMPTNDKLTIDYSFLADLNPIPSPKKTVQASNKDASLLFEIWAVGQRSGEESIKIPAAMGISSRELMRLKTMGFLTGTADEVKFTRKGKIVVTTMALGETNKFEKSRQNKSYTEILASMNKRGKKGFRTAYYSPCTSNVLNLNKLK